MAILEAAVVRQLKDLIDAEARRVFEAKSKRLKVKKTQMENMMRQAQSANPEVCESWRTLQRWWYQCKDHDPKDYAAVLVGGYTGRTALAECSPEAFDYYKTLYLHPRQPSHKDCYRRTVDMSIEKGWVIPSEITLKRKLENEVAYTDIVYRRQGAEALRQTAPFQMRDKSEYRAGEAVVGDGLKFDKFWVKFPDGEIINTATAWIFQDLRSGKLIVFRLGKTECTDLFRMATYDLMGHCLPYEMIIDNTRVAANKQMTGGIDFRFRGNVKSTDGEGMLNQVGITVRFTNPDHTVASPGSKPIERAFGIGGLHDKVASNPKIRGRGYSKATAITSEELHEAIAYEVIRHNAQEKRRSPVCGGVLSFDQAFEQSFKSWSPRKIADAQRRLFLLSRETVRANSKNGMVVIKAGQSQFGKNRYWCEGLVEYRGQSVMVYFDPDDLSKDVDIYSLAGKFLVTAQQKPSVGFNDKEAGQEYNKLNQRRKKLAKKKAENDRGIAELHDKHLPALSEPEKPDSKVVAGLFKKPLAQHEEKAGEVIDAEAAFMNFMKRMGA